MSVYIGPAVWPYGRMIMSHMVADSLEELHEVADKIGMKRSWFQDKNYQHYDVSKGKRALAINCGAIEVTDRYIVKHRIGRKIKP